MKDFWWRFALIGGFTLAGLCCHLAADEEAEAGHRPLGRDDPRLRGRHGEPAARLQHGRADLGAEAARRSRGRQGDPDPQDRQHRIEIILPAGQQRGGRGGQEDADRRRVRWSSASWPTASTTSDVIDRALGPERPGQAAVALQVGAAGRDLDRDQPDVHRRHDHRPAADLEEGPLRRHRGRADRQGRSTATRRPTSVADQTQHRQHADPRASPTS